MQLSKCQNCMASTAALIHHSGALAVIDKLQRTSSSSSQPLMGRLHGCCPSSSPPSRPHLLKHVVDVCLIIVFPRILVVTASIGIISGHKVVLQEDLAPVQQALQAAAARSHTVDTHSVAGG